MFGSLSIGRIAGVPIRVRWTLLVLFAFVAVVARRAPGPLWTFIGCLTVAVLLHELGHALVARRFGVRVLDITFGALGGSANLVGMPDKPRVEGWIALAGPLVNLVVAGVALAFYVFAVASARTAGGASPLTHVERELLEHPLLAMQALRDAWNGGLAPSERARLIAFGFWATNLALGVFNLVPAFPLDGGRVLRAWLATRRSWLAATEAVVRVSRWIVVVGVVVLWFAEPELRCLSIATALFLLFQGARELLVVRLRYGESPIASFTRGFAFGGANPFANAGAEPREAEVVAEESAARTIVDERGATRTRDDDGRSESDPRTAEDAGDEPRRGQARRPRSWGGAQPQRGSGDWVADIENYRGPLRRDDRGEP